MSDERVMGMTYFIPWAGIVQSVWLLATGWTLRGSSPGWGRDFLHPSRPALGSTQPPECWVLTPYHGCKAAGAWRDHPPPSRTELKGGVDLYFYSPFGLSRSVLGWPLPLPLTHVTLFYSFFFLRWTVSWSSGFALGKSNNYRYHSWLSPLPLRNLHGWNCLVRLLIIK